LRCKKKKYIIDAFESLKMLLSEDAFLVEGIKARPNLMVALGCFLSPEIPSSDRFLKVA